MKYDLKYYNVRSRLGQCAVRAVPQGLGWLEGKNNLSAVLIVSLVLKESSATKQVGLRVAIAFYDKILLFLMLREACAQRYTIQKKLLLTQWI